MTDEKRIQFGLLILRLGFAVFFAVWVVEKFVMPETTAKIWAAFYFTDDFPLQASYAIGVFQALVLAGFIIGLFKFWTYGALMIMHGLSTLSTWERLITPYEGVNHLFWAAVPALGVIVVLFMLRDKDIMLNIGRRT